MGSILPTIGSGGAVVRDGDGNDVTPPSVQNAYVPAEELEASCDVTALPSDCTTRVAPAQVNAIVSELLALFWAITPSAVFNCASVTNLATALTAWKTSIEDTFTAVWAAIAGKQPLDEDLTQIAALERANGALIVGGAAAWALLAPGTNNHVLVRDDAAPLKVAWKAAASPAGADGAIQIKSGAGFAESPWKADGHLVPDADGTRAVGSAVARVSSVWSLTTQTTLLYFSAAYFANNWIGMQASADGRLVLINNGSTDFDRVCFGGTSASWPALKRLGAAMGCVLADYTNYAHFYSRNFHCQGVAAYNIIVLTDAATITWSGAAGCAKVTLAGNRTMNAMAAVENGGTYLLWVTQDGTGSRTLSWTTSGAGSFDFGADGAPALSTAAGATDLLSFVGLDIGGTTRMRFVGIKKGFT